MNFIKKTKSICDVCLKTVPAKTFESNGKIMIEKKCPEHGIFRGEHVWDDPAVYRDLIKIETLNAESGQVAAAVTYSCNLNCPVCYARANETAIEDIKIEDLSKLEKYKTVFLTGGEPTVKKDIAEIIKTLRRRGKNVAMFSNGLKFADEKFTLKIKKAGIRNVILQFDTFSDSDYEYIRGKRLLKIKKQVLANLQKFHIPIYLQATVIKDKNFNELGKYFKFAFNFKGVKSVGLNHLWKVGRYDEKDFIATFEIMEKTNEILKIEKKDWTESTRLLCNFDKLLSLLSKDKKKVFGKCNLKCLVLREKNRLIPVTKVFNVSRISKKIEAAYARKSRAKLAYFLVYFFSIEIVLNFFRNKYFRSFLVQLFKNRRYFFSKEFMFFNPFYFLVINIFPTPNNFDYDFVDECNFKAVSAEDFSFQPACLHRILALKKREK